MLADLSGFPGPSVEIGGEPLQWSFEFQVSAPAAASRVALGRATGDPFALVLVEGYESEEQLEAVVVELWQADPLLPILILRERAVAFTGWHLDACRSREQLSFCRRPCEVLEVWQLMHLMTGKWLREREVVRLKKQLADLSRSAHGVGSLDPTPACKIKQGSILVVDDDETIRLVVSQVLATTNHQILTAGNADEAWQQWCQHRGAIRLVITDINMPGDADGVALGQVVQKEDASVPVIYTSGYRAASQFSHLKDGINYLSKPFGMADLLKVVERNLTEAHSLSNDV
ncbi:MAG TPA: response regulator [Prosthecobacter sp.]|nr:response regulator [Prosthecobacter sp.]